jgi:hypothetical protein
MLSLSSTKWGNDCVFVVVDRFYKMVILVAYKKNITAEATAKLFFERIWVHFGIPQTIVSDQDSRFLSIFWSRLHVGPPIHQAGYILESHKPLSQIGTVDFLAHSGQAS